MLIFIFPLTVLESVFLQATSVPFTGETHVLETKFWMLGVLNAARVSLLLDLN